ncbi:GNAT family N-acetyltransferase [Leifsonia sp. 21MFCrub1.1]|uniref:GNAT family N-acetyltransferase n=1 Tax=Leifsonia sp. 21MFCrub1.1 TaxID=1798223 RepID=UPI00089296C7|nr:GNAT family N-acetyltransferase [Leifsonia sp. 21MFCrub1.1]SEA39741.1 L-amino acid N-acyltransferase YncA [Leifsonia sp. 21MFCrub1.1]
MAGLRTATADDAAAFTTVFLDCWHLSYSRTMPAELVERMTPDSAAALWQRALAGGGERYLAAEDDDGTLVGFVGFRLAGPDAGYVSSLYVSPHAQGGGYGRRLLSAAEEELRDLGAATARLWVFEQNEPSRRFYERSGWALDGTRETLPEWGQPQVGMAKRL